VEGGKGFTEEILPPEVCPSCGTPLILDGAHLFCEIPCPANRSSSRASSIIPDETP